MSRVKNLNIDTQIKVIDGIKFGDQSGILEMSADIRTETRASVLEDVEEPGYCPLMAIV